MIYNRRQANRYIKESGGGFRKLIKRSNLPTRDDFLKRIRQWNIVESSTDKLRSWRYIFRLPFFIRSSIIPKAIQLNRWLTHGSSGYRVHKEINLLALEYFAHVKIERCFDSSILELLALPGRLVLSLNQLNGNCLAR